MARKKVVIAVDEAEACRNCHHYRLDDGEKVCKRYPRKFVQLGDEVSVIYPPHSEDDICGEFRRKVNA